MKKTILAATILATLPLTSLAQSKQAEPGTEQSYSLECSITGYDGHDEHGYGYLEILKNEIQGGEFRISGETEAVIEGDALEWSSETDLDARSNINDTRYFHAYGESPEIDVSYLAIHVSSSDISADGSRWAYVGGYLKVISEKWDYLPGVHYLHCGERPTMDEVKKTITSKIDEALKESKVVNSILEQNIKDRDLIIKSQIDMLESSQFEHATIVSEVNRLKAMIADLNQTINSLRNALEESNGRLRELLEDSEATNLSLEEQMNHYKETTQWFQHEAWLRKTEITRLEKLNAELQAALDSRNMQIEDAQEVEVEVEVSEVEPKRERGVGSFGLLLALLPLVRRFKK